MKNAIQFLLFTGLLLLTCGCRHHEVPQTSTDTVRMEDFRVAVSDIQQDSVLVKHQSEVRKPDVAIRVRKGNALFMETEGLQLAAVDTAVKDAGVYTVTSLMEEELPPLPQGMINMTAIASGYRLLPSGEHFSPYAELRVSYDPARLPMGYTPDDIYTSYYDTATLAWVRLNRVEVDTVNHEIVSWTTHFTDFVNELLKAPEMPETQGFAPTAMSDLEAVNPLDGLPVIQPPTANNNGTANITYPIDIPAGRGGMQPNLALTYSSTGGSGWLGVGWDLNIPCVSLDTRWGVPRYSASAETEIYLLNGEQLVTKDADGNPRPMPHRTNKPVGRMSGNVQFYARTGDAHDSIVRHGNSTRNYWWEVVDRNGVTHYYGHYVDSNRFHFPATLADNQGNIARWMLCESRDLDGNTVRYYYVTDTVAGGRQIYLDSISYTGHDSIDGLYTLVFCRTYNSTNDIPVVCNNGFKEITAQSLCNIRLKYDDTIITAWQFQKEYGYKSNYKNRLSSIKKIDAATNGIDNLLIDYCTCLGHDGNEDRPLPSDSSTVVGDETPLEKTWRENNGYTDIDSMTLLYRPFNIPSYAGTTTQFDYYDAPHPDSIFGKAVKSSRLMSYNLRGRLENRKDLIEASATALGLSHTSSWSAGGTLAAGFKTDVWNTTLSGGGNYTHDKSSSESLLTLIDLDGDGLADKVFVKNDKMFFCRRLDGKDGTIIFDSAKLINGPAHFLLESSQTNNLGVQLSLGLIGGNASWPKSTSETSTYFADVNGDGLPDIIDDGKVYFNSLTSDRLPSFTLYEARKLEAGSTDSASVYSVMTSASNCGGIIFDGEVNNNVTCRKVWKFVRAILKYNTIPDLDDIISPYLTHDYRIDTVFSDSTLNIYHLEWDCNPLDDGLPKTEMVRVWIAPEKGTVDITSTTRLLNDQSEARREARHTDGVTLAVQHNHHLPNIGSGLDVPILLDTHYLCDTCYETYTYRESITVDPGDMIFFRLRSHNDRQFDNVETRQQIVYREDPNKFFDSKNDFVLSSNHYFQTPTDGRVFITGQFHDPNGEFEWSIPGFENFNNSPVIFDSGFVSAGTLIHCLVRSIHPEPQIWGDMRCQPYLTFIPNGGGPINYPDTLRTYLPVEMLVDSLYKPLYHRLFGPLYHGWGQFAYHTQDTGTAANYLWVKKLTPPDMLMPGIDSATANASLPSAIDTTSVFDTTTFSKATSLEEFQSITNFYNPLSYESYWVETTPDFEHWRWVGYGDVGNIGCDSMSNTFYERIKIIQPNNDDSIPFPPITTVHDDPVPAAPSGFRTMAVRKVNQSESHNYSYSIAIIGKSYSEGTNSIITDYMDLNGDRYPDIIGPRNVQYSTPWGGLGSLIELSYPGIGGTGSRTNSEGMSFSASNNFPQRTISSSQGNAKFTLSGDGNTDVNGNIGHDTADASWIDINGDGLPDYVTRYGRVYLNTGYNICDDGNWNVRNIHSGVSGSFGLNLGVNLSLWQASIQGGAGLNVSVNQNTVSFLDINGDGLPDRLWRCYDHEDTLENEIRTKVSFNLGNGQWSDAISLNICRFNYSTTFNESINAGLTLGVPIFGFKATGGLRGSPRSGSVNRDRVQLVDVDADGLPDLVSSNQESEMSVRYNLSGRTNLLHTVTNFTGSRIHLEYTLSTPCYEQPSRSWLLTEVSSKDPLNPVGGDTTITRFSYHNPHYDRYERTSYGYGTVFTDQINPADNSTYRIVERDYHNSSMLKRGKVKRELTMAGDSSRYVEKLFDYNYYVSPTDTVDPCEPHEYTSREGTITRYYEGQQNPQLTTGESFLYDRYHNIVRYYDDGDTARHDDGLMVAFTYFTGQPHNLIGLRSGYSVKPSDSSSFLRRASYSYTNKGKLSAQTLYNGSDSAVYNFKYEPVYGNRSECIMPRNDSNQRMTIYYTYDDVVHTYPTQISNSFMESTRTTYNYCYGKPKTVTDPGNNTMTYEYDFAGRIVSVRSPMDTGPKPSLTNQYHTINYYHNGFAPPGYNYNASPTGHPYSICTHFDDNGTDTITQTVVVTDGFGRVIQTKKGLRVAGVNKWQVSGRTVSDPFGRAVEQYDPVVEDAATVHAGSYNPDYDVNSRTTTLYDHLDRVTWVRQPLNVTTQTSYRIGNDQSGRKCYVTAITNPNGDSTITYTDYDGRQQQVTDALGGITAFKYDTLGQLTRSTDPEGFYTCYRYDNLGRLVRRDHPDAGKTEYTYDPAGNLTSETGPRGHIIYEYRFNRLTNKRYNQLSGNNVSYTYNNTGRIKNVYDGSGSLHLKYDALGNVAEETRTLTVPYNNSIYRFSMQYTYDSWGRLRNLVYPDSEQVVYNYQWGGDLYSVVGTKNNQSYNYVQAIQYNSMGQRDSVKYGDGSSARYGYDALHRLDSLVCRDGAGHAIQNIQYTFDNTSNITNIENNCNPVNGLGGAMENRYEYDPIHRMLSSDGSGVSDSYDTELQHTPSGRLVKVSEHINTAQSERWYGYCGDSIPHAPRRILDVESSVIHDLRWDRAGNLSQHTAYNWNEEEWSSRFLYWTEDNRLHTVSDDQHYSYYVYNHTGERTIKLTGKSDLMDVNAIAMIASGELNEVTLYPSPYLVLDNHGYTKHYYAGSERLAARVGCGGLHHIESLPADNTVASQLFDNCVKEISKETTIPNEEECILVPDPDAPPLNELDVNKIHNNIYSKVTIDPTVFRGTMSQIDAPCNWPQNASWQEMEEVYFYHGDHLGSASWITDYSGTPVQYLQYLPFGQQFINQRTSGYNERFTFTGKEKDSETGYGYFGARYMDHEIMTSFLSVDRYADKYPSISPYAYCAWNPIKLIDPTGDTCKYASDAEKHYIMQLLDPENDNYSKEFSDVFHELDEDSYTYIFESWQGDESSDGKFTPTYKDNKTALIQFTMGETKDTRNKLLGMSEFKILFEETFHAWKYKNNDHRNVPTCYSEALAWQFSALAPGTSFFCSEIKDLTVMGYIALSDPHFLAIEFKLGFTNKNYPSKPLYPNLDMYPDNRFRKNIGLPEWH